MLSLQPLLVCFSLEMAGKEGWRDGEKETELDKAGLCSCYNTIPIVCLSFSWLAKKRRRSRRSEEVCLLPCHPPCHTVPPAQVEPADPKEKGGRGFTRGQDASSPSQPNSALSALTASWLWMDLPPIPYPWGAGATIASMARSPSTKLSVATCCIGQEISTGGGRDQK